MKKKSSCALPSVNISVIHNLEKTPNQCKLPNLHMTKIKLKKYGTLKNLGINVTHKMIIKKYETKKDPSIGQLTYRMGKIELGQLGHIEAKEKYKNIRITFPKGDIRLEKINQEIKITEENIKENYEITTTEAKKIKILESIDPQKLSKDKSSSGKDIYSLRELIAFSRELGIGTGKKDKLVDAILLELEKFKMLY